MLPRVLRRWRTRADLSALDDRALRDIGVEPDAVRWPHRASILLLSQWPFPR